MHALEEGRKFERYRVLRHLGKGLSGTTYEAEDTSLQRNVTLKLIHPWSRLPDSARRQFFRDMQSISSLTHPYLAATLDYGEVNGQLYVARRYIGSGTLLGSEGRYWFRPPLESAEAAYYLRQIAQVLYFIHSCGYNHGSLTFSNMLVMRGPRQEHETDVNPFILADVGLVQFVRSFGQPQMSFLPVTAAPELSGKRATPASDQYALGVLLYFWLAGRPPFFGSPEEIEQAKRKEKMTALTTLNTKITFEQEAVIRRAISANPEDRYSSVLAFVDAFVNRLASANPEPVTAPLVQEILILPSTPSPDLASSDEAEVSINLPETPLPRAVMEIVQATNVVATSKKEMVDILLSEFQANTPNTENPFMEMIDLLKGNERSNDTLEYETNDSIQNEITTESPLQLEGVDLFQSQDDTHSVSTLDPASASVSTPNETEQEQPEPIPQKEPDVPQPLPEPVPNPQPLPEPKPAPEPPPVLEPEPEVQPQPGPDITQPLPEPTPHPDPVVPPEKEPEKEDETAQSQEPEATNTVESVAPHFIIHSPYATEPYEAILDQEEVSIGRAGSSHILLDKDAMVSRHHALVRQRDGFFVIADQRSISGVFVNGQKITTEREHLLIDGDSIKIGDYELLFHYKILRHTSDLS